MGYKNIVIVFFLFGLSFQAISQGIPLQLMVVDADGFEMPNKQVKLRLTLTNDTSSSTGQYQEVHITQTNDFGIVSASIGKGVATTNSSVFGIEQFSFNATEPLIKIELDTSSTSNQYYMIGAITYSYPMVSQRALKADSSSYSLDASNAEYSDTAEFARNSDSSAYSLHASNAEYSDTAEFARNFDESLDNDTSVTNEIQSLSFINDTLSISQSNDIVIPLSSFQNYSLKCVDMGASDSCYAWGFSSAAAVAPTNHYTYSLHAGFNGNNGNLYHPHWRKFQVEGLSLNVNDKLIIKQSSVRNTWVLYSNQNSYFQYYKPDFAALTPIIENGNVYFKIYASPTNYSGPSSQCLYDGICYDPTQGCYAISNFFGDFHFEILIDIEGSGSLKHTGIYFTIEAK